MLAISYLDSTVDEATIELRIRRLVHQPSADLYAVNIDKTGLNIRDVMTETSIDANYSLIIIINSGHQ